MHLVPFIRQVLLLTKPYRLRFALGILAGILAGVAAPLLIVSVKLAITAVFPDSPEVAGGDLMKNMAPFLRRWLEHLPSAIIHPDLTSPNVRVLAIAAVPTAMFLRGFFTYLNIYLMNWVAIRSVNDLRAKLFRHLLSLSSSFFSDNSTGSLMAHLNAAATLQTLIGSALVVIFKEPISLIATFGVLVFAYPSMSLLAFTVLPVTLVPFIIYARKVRKSSAAMQQQVTEQSKLVHETLTGYRIVKAYNLEDTVEKEFVKTSNASLNHAMRVLRAAELPGPLIEFLGSVCVAVLLVYASRYAKGMNASDLLTFILGIFSLYQPIKAVLRLHTTTEAAEATTNYMFKVLATPSAITEPAKPKALAAAGKDVHFDHITFSYGEKSVLHDIDLTVKSGQVVALVGGSGAGKTTLTNLLLRFYDPQQGTVRIGDTDIRDVASGELRRQIAVVTQETILFNDTVRRNIELGRPGASEEEIVLAAKHAYAHDFTNAKEEGYQTVIGEKGISLSGGQRQRVAIARAIVKDAPILILDEAMSALDTESERLVQIALDGLMKGRTTICIAHRLSTIQNADVIVVMDQGRIVEKGRHAELLAKNGYYRRLYELQFRDEPDAKVDAPPNNNQAGPATDYPDNTDGEEPKK